MGFSRGGIKMLAGKPKVLLVIHSSGPTEPEGDAASLLAENIIFWPFIHLFAMRVFHRDVEHFHTRETHAALVTGARLCITNSAAAMHITAIHIYKISPGPVLWGPKLYLLPSCSHFVENVTSQFSYRNSAKRLQTSEGMAGSPS